MYAWGIWFLQTEDANFSLIIVLLKIPLWKDREKLVGCLWLKFLHFWKLLKYFHRIFFLFIKGFFIGKELTIQYIKQSMNKK